MCFYCPTVSIIDKVLTCFCFSVQVFVGVMGECTDNNLQFTSVVIVTGF